MTHQSIGRGLLFLLVNAALMAPVMVYSAGASQEVQTAAQHAEFAGKAEKLSQTQLHLHHVINCLEGPDGKDFDAKAGNPCAGQGSGALNDEGTTMEQQEMLQQVLTLARVGTQLQSYKPAHYTALAVIELLQEVSKGM